MTTLQEMKQRLPEERRAKIDARTQELIAEELTLQELRKALDLTQKQIAKNMDIGQDNVSRLEKRGDLHISTLRNYVEAIGGHLRLTVEFPDRPPVDISPLS